MMNAGNLNGKARQMKDWRRRLVALVAALSLLISSCGLTAFAESDEDIYSAPVTAPIAPANTSPEPEEGGAEVTPAPEGQDETGTEPAEETGEETGTEPVEETGEETGTETGEGETEGEPEVSEEPEDLMVYESGTLTAEADGINVTLDYAPEARIPEGAVLTLARAAGGDLYSTMKAAARVLKEEANETWKRELGDEAVFYLLTLTTPEGIELHPTDGLTLTCTNLSIPAGSTGFVTGTSAENIDWDGELTLAFLPDAIGYANLKQVQIGTITLVHNDRDYMVTASYGPEAGFPVGTALKVREIMPGTPEYALYSGMTDEALNEDWSEITLERYFDIAFVKDDEELEPQAEVDVQITFRDKIEENEDTEVAAVHIENNEATVIESETDSQVVAKHDDEAIDTVTFTSDSFSVYGVVQKKKIITKILEAGGQTYEIGVTYTQEAEIPEDAQIKVEEIPEGSDLYNAYKKQTAAALNADDVRLPGLYDISIVDAENNKVEPKVPVSVAIKLLNDENTTEDIQIVHFKEEIPQELVEAEAAAQQETQTEETTVEQTEDQPQEQTEVQNQPLAEEDKIESEEIKAKVEGDTVTFETQSFSVYAFAYAVDFYFGDFEYHMPGNGTMLLSELFTILNIDINIYDVASVEFTTPELLAVYHITEDKYLSQILREIGVYEELSDAYSDESENKEDRLLKAVDWLLVSLKPFKSNEYLIVTMTDGNVLKIIVEDGSAPYYHFLISDPSRGHFGLSGANGVPKIVNNDNKKYDHGELVSFDFYHDSTAYVMTYAVSGSRRVWWFRDDGATVDEKGGTWRNDGGSPNLSITDKDVTFICYFAPNDAKLIVIDAPDSTKGKVNNTKLVNNNANLPSYRYTSGDGMSGAITAESNAWNIYFKGWYTENDELYSTNQTIEMSNITSDIHLKPVFEDAHKYHIIANESGIGKFWIPNYNTNGPQNELWNLPSERVPNEGCSSFGNPVVAEPANGNYEFAFWLRDDGKVPVTSGNRLLGFKENNVLRPDYNRLERETTYVGCFKPKGDYFVRVNSPEEGGYPGQKDGDTRKFVYIKPNPNNPSTWIELISYYYAYQQRPTITATPYSGYVFDGWYNNGNELISTDSEFDVAAYFDANPDKRRDLNLTPVFRRVTEYFHVWFDGTNGLGGGDLSRNNTLYARADKGIVSGAKSIHRSVRKNGDITTDDCTAPLRLLRADEVTPPMGSGSTHFVLQGWYEVYSGQYFAPGQEITIDSDCVFYADWFADNYSFAQAGGSSSDTSGFITTHVFDYNSLFNMASIHLDKGQSVIPTEDQTDNINSYNKEYWYMNGDDSDFVFLDTVSAAGRSLNPYGRDYKNSNRETGTDGGYFTAYRTTGLLTSDLRDRLFGATDNLGKRHLGTGNYLFKYDASTGYYYFDSDLNAASYNQNAQRFYVYDYKNKTNKSYAADDWDFLPLNYGNTTFTEGNGEPNYWFGMSSSIRFFLPNAVDGTVNNSDSTKVNKPTVGDEMIFKFAGDDDVWVYVDGDLILDMGGVHGKVYGEINFSRGTYSIVSKGAKKASGTLGYEASGDQKETYNGSWSEGNHTLTIYYLERGGSQSNCAIYFNLAPRYSLRLEKNLLDGGSPKDAVFGVFTDAECTIAAKLQDSVSGDETNEFSTDENGVAICTGLVAGNTYYIKELVPPDGYPSILNEVITLAIDAQGHATVTPPSDNNWMVTESVISSEDNPATKGQFLITLKVNNRKKTSITAKKVWSLFDGEKYVTFTDNGKTISISENTAAFSKVKLQRRIESTEGDASTIEHTVNIVQGYFEKGGKPSAWNDGTKKTLWENTLARVPDDGSVTFTIETDDPIGIYSVSKTNGTLNVNRSERSTGRPYYIDGGRSNLYRKYVVTLSNIQSDSTIYIYYLGDAGDESGLISKTHVSESTVVANGTPRKLVEDTEFNSSSAAEEKKLDKASNWMTEWDNLDSSSASGNNYYYYIIETESSTSQSSAGVGFIHTYSSNGMSGGTITVNNALEAVKVKLRKKDANQYESSNVNLQGAEFYIYTEQEYLKKQNDDSSAAPLTPNASLISQDEMGTPVGTKLVTDAAGRFYTGLLPEGIYYIVEENPPHGYQGLAHDIKIKVDKNGLSYDMTGGNSLTPRTADSDGFYNLYIDNSIANGSIEIEKKWIGALANNSINYDDADAVLISLGRIVDGAVDSDWNDILTNPSEHNLTDKIYTDSATGNQYIKISKDTTNGTWPVLTVNNLPLVKVIQKTEGTTKIVPVDCYYFIEEFGYLVGDVLHKIGVPADFDWTVTYSGVHNDGSAVTDIADKIAVTAKETEPDRLIVTNAKNPTTSIDVKKVWADEDSQEHTADTVTIKLIRYKKSVASQQVEQQDEGQGGQQSQGQGEQQGEQQGQDQGIQSTTGTLTIAHDLPSGFSATYTISGGPTTIQDPEVGIEYTVEPGEYIINTIVSGEAEFYEYQNTPVITVPVASGEEKTATVTSNMKLVGSIQINQELTGAGASSETFTGTYVIKKNGVPVDGKGGSYENMDGALVTGLEAGDYTVEVTGTDSTYTISDSEDVKTEDVTVVAGERCNAYVSHALAEPDTTDMATVILYINDSNQTDRTSNVGITLSVPKNSDVYLSYSTFVLNQNNTWDPASELLYWDDSSIYYQSWVSDYTIASENEGPINNKAIRIGNKDAYCVLIKINSNKKDIGTYNLTRNSSMDRIVRFRASNGSVSDSSYGSGSINIDDSSYFIDPNLEETTVILNDANNWISAFTDQPVYDENGNVYYYGIVETKINQTAVSSSDYTVTYNRDYVSAENAATFTLIATNTPKFGALDVTKHIVGGSVESFHFTVTLDDETVNGQYQDMDFTGGIAVFDLKNGETAKATGLPAGITYTVTEDPVGEYSTVSTGETGKIPANGIAHAEFTNSYTPTTGSLALKKIVLADNGAPINGDLSKTNGTYFFTVADSTETVIKYIAIKATSTSNGATPPEYSTVYTYKVSNEEILGDDDSGFVEVPDQGVVISGLAPGSYTITEDTDNTNLTSIIYGTRMQLDDLTVTAGNADKDNATATVSVEAGNTASVPTATFTNKLVPVLGSLKITKVVTDGSENNSDALTGTYKFSVNGKEKTSTAGITHTVDIIFEKGFATSYKIDGVEADAEGIDNTYSVIIRDLVIGEYIVEETDSDTLALQSITGGTSLSDNSVSATVSEDVAGAASTTVEVVFTNTTYDTIDINATKQFPENTAIDQQPKAIRFELFTYTDNDVTKKTSVNPTTERPNPVVIVRDSNNEWGTATWTELDKYVNRTDPLSGEIKYLVEETGVFFGELVNEQVPAGQWIINSSDPSYKRMQLSEIYQTSYLSDPNTDGTVTINEDTNIGSITVTNEPKLTEVVVNKSWSPEFTDEKYTWEATFILKSDKSDVPIEDFKLKSDASDAEPHDSITISNTSTENERTIIALPIFTLDNNNVPQKITYTVEETGYTVKYEGSEVLKVVNGVVVSGEGSPYTPYYSTTSKTEGSQIVAVSNSKQTDHLIVKKKWVEVLEEDLDDMPTVRFRLMWRYADENDPSKPENMHPYPDAETVHELSANTNPAWQWTCTDELPTTMYDEKTGTERDIVWFVKEVLKYDSDPSYNDKQAVDYVLPIELNEYQAQHFIIHVDGYETDQSTHSDTFEEPYKGYITGNTGTITIRNRCVNEYMQVDVKKKLFKYGDDGSLHTVTSDPNFMKGLVLKIQIYRRIVLDKPVTIDPNTHKVIGDQLEILQVFKPYGTYMYVGYHQNGDAFGDNRGNVYDFRKPESEGPWHWTIGNTEQNKGFPRYGFFTDENGVKHAARYEYLVVEEGAYKDYIDGKEVPLDDYSYFSVTPALWDGIYKGGIECQIEEFERITAEDQDRLVNRQSTDLKITKQWNINPNGRKVYVKLYRTKNQSYDANNGTIIDVTNTGLSYSYDGWLGAQGKGLTCVVENAASHVTEIDGQTYIVLNGNETVTIHNVERGDESGGYRYWIQEVGYEDSTGRYLNETNPFETAYEVTAGNIYDLMNVPNNLKDKISKAIILSELGNNHFTIKNTLQYVTQKPEASKELNGVPFNGTDSHGDTRQFEFELVQKEPATPQDQTPYSQIVFSDKNNGTITFEDIEYTSTGRYVYEISEKKPENADENMIYDAHKFYVKIEISEDALAGDLMASAPLYFTDQACTIPAPNGAVFDNIELGEMSLTKRVTPMTGSELPDGIEDVGFDFKIVLTIPENAGEMTSVPVTIGTSTNDCPVQTDPSDSSRFITVTLKKDQTATIGKLPVGTQYSITETNAPDYILTWTSGKGNSGTISATVTKEAELTNTPAETELIVVKKDKGNPLQTLSGAVFVLTEVDEHGDSVTGGWTEKSDKTGEDGTIHFTKLKPGYYRITEDESPDGYIPTNESITIQVMVEGDVAVAKRVGTDELAMIEYDQDTRTVTIYNTSGVELPSTGGSGTLIYTIAGMALIVLAGVLLVSRRKRRT